jgi:uncharacterized delta-60 repeat protein
MQKFILFSLLTFSIVSASVAYIYAAPGDLDRGFGTSGIVKTQFREASSINASTIQPDGKIIVVGSIRRTDFTLDFYVMRFNANGSFDTTFGNNGKLIVVVSNRDDEAFGVTLQADGKIVVVGSSRDSSANYNFSAARLNQNGTLDTTFNTSGFVITPINSTGNISNKVVVQPDNKIVVAGQGPGTSDSTFIVVRYNIDGSLDTSFDGDGISKIQFSPSLNSSARAVKLQADGKIVVAGVSSIVNFNSSGFGIARLNTNGTPDTSFGNNGTVIVDVRTGTAQQSAANELLIQPDGKIVAVGSSNSGFTTDFDFAVVRLNTNGSLDNSFGDNGKVVTPIQGYNSDEARDVVLQTDGKIVVGGTGKVASDTDLAVIRYNSNGTPDTTFGNKGIVLTRITETYEGISNLRIEPDGKIFAVGLATFSGGSNYELTLARYLINGTREMDFDGNKTSDISVFRPSNGIWYLNNSTQGYSAVQFGASGDLIVPADYDGDGKTDVAVYRAGTWYLQRSNSGFANIQFGLSTDIPVPADFDGNGKAELAVYRPSNGTWYVLNETTNQYTSQQWGLATDKPVVADYDGDGKADYAVYRPSNGTWYLLRSRDGFAAVQWGLSTDKPVVGDYDGDGKADAAVYRPSNGTWYLSNSSSGFASVQFGEPEDKPTPADYDGDGKTDIAVFRPSSGTWYQMRSMTGFFSQQFGASEDLPAPNAFVR